jgi:hypothetical protein
LDPGEEIAGMVLGVCLDAGEVLFCSKDS